MREDRRRAEAKAASSGAAFAPGSFVAYLAGAFARGMREGRFLANVLGGDILLGRRFAFFRYPEAVLKLVSIIKGTFGPSDVAARRLEEDEAGARLFLARLKADEGLFVDPATGLWKLKATLEEGGASEVKEGVLIPRAHLGEAAAAAGVYAGTVRFNRSADGSEVVIDDFRSPPADPPPALLALPRRVPATLGPPSGEIDPDTLVRDLLQGILEGWIPTNVAQGQVYVTPRLTFAATPMVFIKMRERGLYPEFDPQDRTSAFLRALARLDFVRKSAAHRIVYPILLGPESERPLKVVKFDTLGLFRSREVRDRIGVWKDWEKIIELPQTWKPGDAILPEEESE